jgi:Porphobilinogen deaminase, dipyromethane cofactor binding domain
LREQCGQQAVVVTVATPGDESTAPIERLDTTGVFTTTLREALLHGAVDLAARTSLSAPARRGSPGQIPRHQRADHTDMTQTEGPDDDCHSS